MVLAILDATLTDLFKWLTRYTIAARGACTSVCFYAFARLLAHIPRRACRQYVTIEEAFNFRVALSVSACGTQRQLFECGSGISATRSCIGSLAATTGILLAQPVQHHTCSVAWLTLVSARHLEALQAPQTRLPPAPAVLVKQEA